MNKRQLAVNTLYLLAWTPIAHRRFMPGLHRQWLLHDIAPAMLAAGLCGAASRLLPWVDGRVAVGLQLLAVAVAVLLAATTAVACGRRALLQLWGRPT